MGYRVTSESLAFGGHTLCATDIAVAAGHAEIGSRSLVADLPRGLVKSCHAHMQAMLENAVDQVKVNTDPMPLLLVGGGAILISEDIAGTSEVIVPEHAAVANAVGASITQISGETDRIFTYEASGRDVALDLAIEEAKTKAVEAGADRGSLEVLDLEEVPLAYMPGGATRIRVKVTGNPSDVLTDDEEAVSSKR